MTPSAGVQSTQDAVLIALSVPVRTLDEAADAWYPACEAALRDLIVLDEGEYAGLLCAVGDRVGD